MKTLIFTIFTIFLITLATAGNAAPSPASNAQPVAVPDTCPTVADKCGDCARDYVNGPNKVLRAPCFLTKCAEICLLA